MATTLRPEASRVISELWPGRLTTDLVWHELDKASFAVVNQVVERAEREEATGLVPEFARALAALVPDPDQEALMPFRIGYPPRRRLRARAGPRRR